MRQDIVAIAREASELIRSILREARGLDVSTKQDGSPLTRADLAVNALIVERLRAGWTYPVIAEESAEVPYEARKDWPRVWLVDPLDGTRDFVAGTGDFTVNIALIEAGRSIAGAIAAPMLDTVWSAVAGEGAFRSRGAEPEVRIRCEPTGPLVLLASRFHRDAEITAYAERHGIVELRTFGSAVKFAKLAEGEADLYPRFGRTMEWDIAAGQAIVEAAGGTMVELRTGAPIRYNKPDLAAPPFVAASPRLASLGLAALMAPATPARP